MARYNIIRYQVSLGKLKYPAGENIVEVEAGIRAVGEDAFLDICFVPDGAELPLNVSHPFNSSFRPLSEYVYYLDLLRNEKPLYIDIYENEPARHGISTGYEPIGEGENTF